MGNFKITKTGNTTKIKLSSDSGKALLSLFELKTKPIKSLDYEMLR